MVWWAKISGQSLMQGDLVPDCRLPIFVENPVPRVDDEPSSVEVKLARLIVVSQSCDLANGKIEFVALCPIHTLQEFEVSNPDFKLKGRWEPIRKETKPALHLIASPDAPEDNRSSYVVDFGHIVSVPLEYLKGHAGRLGDRWRLESPF